MSVTTIAVFESAVADAHEWLNAICVELDTDDRHFSLQALRAVLHALRDHLTIEQNAHLSAQLPILIRGLYFEGWKPGAASRHDRSVEGFIELVAGALTGYVDVALEDLISGVFAVLRLRISWGEDEKIAKALPHAIAELWNAEP